VKIGDFLKTLQAAGLHADLTDLRDLFWLAPKLTVEPGAAPVVAELKRDDAATPAAAVAPVAAEAAAKPVTSRAGMTEGEPDSAVFYAAGGSGVGGAAARRVQLRGAPALPDALAIGRALRPLSRRRSGNRVELDERATAEFIAETGFRAAVYRPAFERWFDIVVAIEEVPSLAAWRPAVSEFERVLRRQGGFRTVRTVLLRQADRRVTAHSVPDGREMPVRGLHDRNGRRIVLVVSDCTSSAWRGGAMGEWLRAVSERAPVAVAQLLPQALWPNTATGFAELRTQSPRVGAPAAQMRVRSPSWAHGEPGVVVPVLALEPSAVATWVRMATAAGNAWGTAALFPLPGDEDDSPPAEDLAPAQRAAAFRASTTPDAQRLAAYFSVVRPLTPPVMRVIHRAMAPKSGTVALAQVFLGGLLQPVAGGATQAPVDEVIYDFHPGLRDRLAAGLSRRDFVEVNLALHDYLQQETGTPFDFFALIEDRRDGDVSLPAAALPFAQSARAFARRFGEPGGGGAQSHATAAPPAEEGVAQLEILLSGTTLSFIYRSERGQLTLRHDFTTAAALILENVLTGGPDTLFESLAELVVPLGLQDTNAVANGPGFVELLLDAKTSAFPWEALIRSNHASTRPLALARGMTRRLLQGAVRTPPESSARSSRALVIGDPLTNVPGLHPLPSARREAEQVGAMLSTMLPADNVRLIVAKGAREVVSAFFEADFRVLHIASHSVLAPQQEKASYASVEGLGRRVQIVLDGGVHLGIHEFGALERMPELVFLGIHFSASMAPELLSLGAQVVVGAVGSIDDEQASTFALAFYQALTQGAALIDAMRDARRQCLKAHPSTDTWGRFQCYGDAQWRLVDVEVPISEPASAVHATAELADEPLWNRIFVSSPRADDVPHEGSGEGWVSGLVRRLGSQMPDALFAGRGSAVAAGEIPGHLNTALDSCGRLLIVMSHAYQASVRCKEELDRFLARHANGPAAGSIQIVEIEPVDHSTWHPALREVSTVKFWEGRGGHLPPQRIEAPSGFAPGADDPYETRLADLLHRFGLEPSAAPSVDPAPRSWVLVAGTGHNLNMKLAQTCDALGAALARSGHGIVTGGWPGVDEAVGRSFARELERMEGSIPIDARLIHVMVHGDTPAFSQGRLVQVRAGDEKYSEAITRADFVVMVGGLGVTMEIAKRAHEAGRVVLPLADTGGDARKFHLRMEAEWSSGEWAAIDISELTTLATEAPGVIDDLPRILDRLLARSPS
jgi:hypothetical protein